MKLRRLLLIPLFSGVFFCAFAQQKIKDVSTSKIVKDEISAAFASASLSRVSDQLNELPAKSRILFFSVIVETNATGSV